MTTCLHGTLPRRLTPPGATYELAETVQTSGATSVFRSIYAHGIGRILARLGLFCSLSPYKSHGRAFSIFVRDLGGVIAHNKKNQNQ